jgi:fluoroquinolone resistance protein
MNNEYHVMSEEEFLSRLADKATFSNIELRDAEIQENISYDLVLQQCKFVRCSVQNSVWENVRASSSTFIACDFTDTNFEDAVFERCSFFDTTTSQACCFLRSRLRSASFKQCRISSCIFEGADLFLSSIEDSEAVGAKFFKAHFDGSARFLNTIFKYADLRGADLSTCDISHNSFVWAVLDEANFEKATLIGSDLSGASLRFTKFTQADLRGAVLGQLDLRVTDLQGTKIFEHQMRGLLENCEIIIFPDRR